MARLSDTQTAFGAVTKLAHWLTALTVFGMIGLGLYMADLPLGAAKLELYGLHKSIGVVVLVVTLARFGWRSRQPGPGALPSHVAWEHLLAKATHLALYACLIGLPLTGWIASSAAGFPVSVFGLFTLPNLVGPDPSLQKGAAAIHSWMAWAMMGLIGLHILGALKHHVVDKDETLRRMAPHGAKSASPFL
ncbi:cytochrome b [Rhodospirillum sp. A1_3_36]|uniref:cytochrome b n=1 Tax=Rhodospirillum sp. A1_3_36 TaxID=3391666 RepID=UPI0039A40F7D